MTNKQQNKFFLLLKSYLIHVQSSKPALLAVVRLTKFSGPGNDKRIATCAYSGAHKQYAVVSEHKLQDSLEFAAEIRRYDLTIHLQSVKQKRKMFSKFFQILGCILHGLFHQS